MWHHVFSLFVCCTSVILVYMPHLSCVFPQWRWSSLVQMQFSTCRFWMPYILGAIWWKLISGKHFADSATHVHLSQGWRWLWHLIATWIEDKVGFFFSGGCGFVWITRLRCCKSDVAFDLLLSVRCLHRNVWAVLFVYTCSHIRFIMSYIFSQSVESNAFSIGHHSITTSQTKECAKLPELLAASIPQSRRFGKWHKHDISSSSDTVSPTMELSVLDTKVDTKEAQYALGVTHFATEIFHCPHGQ